MEFGGESPDGEDEDPCELDCEHNNEEVEEEALGAPGDGSEHELGVAHGVGVRSSKWIQALLSWWHSEQCEMRGF